MQPFTLNGVTYDVLEQLGKEGRTGKVYHVVLKSSEKSLLTKESISSNTAIIQSSLDLAKLATEEDDRKQKESLKEESLLAIQTDISFRKEEKLKPHYALKTINLSSQSVEKVIALREEAKTELATLSLLQNNGLVKLLDYGFDRCPPSKIFLLLEYCKNGNLNDLTELVSTRCELCEETRSIYVHALAQLLSALCYLQEQGVIHRDIKAENIVLDEKYRVKIIDFGSADLPLESEGQKRFKSLSSEAHGARLMSTLSQLSNQSGFHSRRTYIGSPNYISPEMIEFQRNPKDISKTDIWSFGVLAYFLFTRQFPFVGENNYKRTRRIQNEEPDLSKVQDSEVRELIAGALIKDSKKRITLEEMKKLVLFKKIDFSLISEQESPIVSILASKCRFKIVFQKEMQVKGISKKQQVRILIRYPSTQSKKQFNSMEVMQQTYDSVRAVSEESVYVLLRDLNGRINEKFALQKLNIRVQGGECVLTDKESGEQRLRLREDREKLDGFVQACQLATRSLEKK